MMMQPYTPSPNKFSIINTLYSQFHPSPPKKKITCVALSDIHVDINA